MSRNDRPSVQLNWARAALIDGSGTSKGSYREYIGSGPPVVLQPRPHPPHLLSHRPHPPYHLQGRSDVCTVAKFRLGDHWLNVQRERLRGVARAERCCPRCPGVVEDEVHIMECPLYSGPRQRFLLACEVFLASDAGMCAAMNGTERAFWVALAQFLHDCIMRVREDFTNQAPPAAPS